MLTHSEMIVRIVAGSVLGGIIGYERDRHGRPVGLRTHLIVAMASATFMVLSTEFVYYQHYRANDLVEVDASRIAASVVSGIGFLAGGAILRTGLSVQGLTTAAGLWLVTALGMCAGAGMFVEGVVVTGFGFFALTALRRFEDKDDRTTRRRIALVLGAETENISDMMQTLEGLGAVVSDVDYDRRLDDKRRVNLTIDARLPRTVTLATLVEALESRPGVRRVHILGAS
jgi:putative Mg2+ transporter-C (MgtC) family protein